MPKAVPHEMVRLSVTTYIDGREHTATMPYFRFLWDDVDDHDREQLRLIARSRFANWVRKVAGVQLPRDRVDALPVSVIYGQTS
jgi:hypothetical protein